MLPVFAGEGIHFNYERIALAQALDELVRTHGTPILFRKRQLKDITVSGECRECSLADALDRLLADTRFGWQKVGEQVVITRREVKPGGIRGRILHAEDERPLAGVDIYLLHPVAKNGSQRVYHKTRSTGDGSFSFSRLKTGPYGLRVAAAGLSEFQQKDIVVEENMVWDLTVRVTEVGVDVRERVVGPSSYQLLAEGPAPFQYLDKRQIAELPHLGDDIYRTVKPLPGAESDDIAATFRVRGSRSDEVQILLNGMELYDPFHMLEFGGLFSIIDPEVVGNLHVMTGGFPVQYGNRMSGVFSMQTSEPRENLHEVGLSVNNARYRTEGTFAEGLGRYQFSIRRGYVEILLDLVDDVEDVRPVYGDSVGRLQYALGERHNVTLNFLLSRDDFFFAEDPGEEIGGSHDNDYWWSQLQTAWNDRVSSDTTFYHAEIAHRRNGFDQVGSFQFSLADFRNFRYRGIKQDWEISFSPRTLLKAGWDWREEESRYDYSGWYRYTYPLMGTPEDRRQNQLRPEGRNLSAYAAIRRELTPQLTAELGLRYDNQDWLDAANVSPRLNMSYHPSRRLSLHLAGGRFYQPKGTHELQVGDDVTEFTRPEYADQLLAGVRYHFGNGVDLRLEAYLKDMKDLSTRYDNLFSVISAVPEFEEDRVAVNAEKGRAQGVELSLHYEPTGAYSWMFAYTHSKVEDWAEGAWLPRKWDQRHTAGLTFNYRRPGRWTFSSVLSYHSGWRATDYELLPPDETNPFFRIEVGDWYAGNFGEVQRLDLRYTNETFMRNGKGFRYFFDVANAFNRENPRGYDEIDVYVPYDRPAFTVPDTDDGLPLLPTFGMSYRF
ncbi:MAG: TonB-dependent receptor [Acidobacteriota bacterium]|nr:TonB-dependent receptor [Acidobacteriota bacterium]